MTCCVTGPSNEVQRWTGCLGAEYASGRVLMVGAVHNKPVLSQDRAPLALAAKVWVDAGRSGGTDAAYLAEVRDFYRQVTPTWENGGTVWRTFAKLRAQLGVRSEEVAFSNIAKCEMHPSRQLRQADSRMSAPISAQRSDRCTCPRDHFHRVEQSDV